MIHTNFLTFITYKQFSCNYTHIKKNDLQGDSTLQSSRREEGKYLTTIDPTIK